MRNKQLHCKSGEHARLLPVWPGFDSGRMSHVGGVSCWFSPCFEVVSLGSLLFFPPQEPTSQNSNLTGMEDLYENQLRLT